jgi:Trk K+ transport system NAD-binding subunit
LGADIVCEDARRIETLQQAGLDQARVLVSILRNVDRSLEVCQLAQEHFAPPTIVAWLEDATARSDFHELGVRTVIPSLATMEALENVVRYPDAYLFLSDLEEEGTRVVQELTLRHSDWEGLPLRRLPLPEDILILAIRRGPEFVVPRGKATLQQGDFVTLMGHPSAVDRARDLFEF